MTRYNTLCPGGAQEIYSTQTDVTLNQPITSSDGSLSAFATDDSHMAANWSAELRDTAGAF
jgi:hypothetical protein